MVTVRAAIEHDEPFLREVLASAADVPELTIGVVANRRGEGIGRLLLAELVLEARHRGIERISLSVEADNPAIFLYADFGFVEVSRVADSPTMVLDCRMK